MAVESATKISQLNPLWPLGTDPKSEGDQHIRMLKSVLQSSDGGAVVNVVRQIISTSQTYTRPAGLKFLEVVLIGGGGGGTGSGAIGAGQSVAGGGGGGGATVIKLYKAADVGSSVVVTIGAGGSSGSGSAGGNGGGSIFMGLSAGGGLGGGAGMAGGTTFLATGGVQGGTPGGGDIGIYGDQGEQGLRCCHGSPIVAYPGEGGGTLVAARRIGSYFGSGGAAGTVGYAYGGGGSGSAGSASAGALAGGGGAAGVCILKEYF